MPSYKYIAGVDEAGRGPWAGAVFAAAVILPSDFPTGELKDSKKLVPAQRERLYPLICEHAIAYCIAQASCEEIDRLNILQATLLAMRRAVEGLATQADFVQVDGNRLPQWDYASEFVIQGDAKIAAISAASILAKVARDRDCLILDAQFPEYGFAKHKGYGTAAHAAALQQFGPCSAHRKSFSPIRRLLAQG